MSGEAIVDPAPITDDRTRTGSRLRRARVDRMERTQRRDLLVDLAFVVALSVVTGLALGPAFGGTRYLVLVALGALVGMGSAAAATRARLGWSATVGVCVAAFVLFAGPAVDHAAIGGVLPSPEMLVALTRGLIHAWSDATTTAPPVGVADGLGVIPYVSGFASAAGATLLARRTEWPMVPALPFVAALVLNIVLGTLEPHSLILQGGLLLALALAWGAVRANRPRRQVDGSVYWPRILTGSAMLAVVAAIGVVVGPALPLVGEDGRQVIREHVEPPFDPRNQPSPLNGFRNYIAEPGDEEVFFEIGGLPEEAFVEMGGLPKSAWIRLATMDTYDGTVWAVGGPTAPASGMFDRVGTAIVPTPPGEPATIEVDVVGYRGIWVPTIGATRSTDLGGPRGDELRSSFRFNRSTGDGASPLALEEGDRYQTEVRLHDNGHERAEGKKASADILAEMSPLPEVPEDVRDRASQLVTEASDYAKAEKLEDEFRKGFYSDGGEGVEDHMKSSPGHSLRRMSTFLDVSKAPLGNAEQYAATMALVARMNGLPARVVMGFVVPEDDWSPDSTQVLGTHVHAWVEIAFEDVGWVVFDPTPDRNRHPEPEPPPITEPDPLEIQPEPEHRYMVPPDLDANRSNEDGEEADREEVSTDGGGGISPLLVMAATYVGGPALLAGLGASSIVAAKSTRRRRRRGRGSPASQVAGAWREAVDTVRDTGSKVSGRGTRSDLARSVPEETWADAPDFASQVDAVMFGPDDPTEESVRQLWEQADEQRRAVLAPLSRPQRIRAELSLRSFRGLR